MTSSRARRFLDALHRLEDERQLAPLIGLFSDDAEISHPIQHEPEEGQSGAKRFFEQYRNTFGRVHTEMRRVMETSDAAVLEWTCRGTCREDRNIHYDGVTILEFDGERIRALRTYFDPGVLHAHVYAGHARPASNLRPSNGT